MKKKHCLLLILLLFIFSSNIKAQFIVNDFWQGEIIMVDGSVKKGFIKVPNKPDANNVSYKQTKDGRKESVESELIESINIISSKGAVYIFERIATRKNPKKSKLSKRRFLLIYKKGSSATFYLLSTGYETDSKTGTITIVHTFVQGQDLPTFTYFIRKKDQSFADILGLTSLSPTMFGLDKTLKTRAKYVLADDPELVERIMKGEFKHTDIPSIIDIYLKEMDEK